MSETQIAILIAILALNLAVVWVVFDTYDYLTKNKKGGRP